MLGKLLYGQFSLKETFWKFGFVGVLFLGFVAKICKAFLAQNLKGLPIAQYYTHYFSPLNIDGSILFFTALYFVSLFILGVYSLIVFLGIWRSAAAYDKSVWLGHLAKLFIVLIIYFAFHMGL